jgi:hypothetical protein
MSALFEHIPHPHIAARKAAGPVTVAGQMPGGANARIALRLTALVGTMQAAYAFAVLAVLALPAVLGFNWFPPRTLLIVAWISQTFIQLVMLAVLQLGQNLSAAGADARSQATYLDAEAVLHEVQQIQAHLEVQDGILTALAARIPGQSQATAAPPAAAPLPPVAEGTAAQDAWDNAEEAWKQALPPERGHP